MCIRLQRLWSLLVGFLLLVAFFLVNTFAASLFVESSCRLSTPLLPVVVSVDQQLCIPGVPPGAGGSTGTDQRQDAEPAAAGQRSPGGASGVPHSEGCSAGDGDPAGPCSQPPGPSRAGLGCSEVSQHRCIRCCRTGAGGAAAHLCLSAASLGRAQSNHGGLHKAAASCLLTVSLFVLALRY